VGEEGEAKTSEVVAKGTTTSWGEAGFPSL